MVEDLAKELEQFYLDNPVKVFVPTLQRDYNFRPISVGQQKQLIDLERDDEASMEEYLEVPKIFNSLIKSTSLDENLYKDLTIVDRPAILLQLKYSTKPTIDLLIEDSIHNVNLKPYVQNLRQKKPKVKFQKTISVGSFMVHLHVPTLEIDHMYNELFLSRVGDDDLTSNAVLAECCKFIRKIETSKETTFDFTLTEPEVMGANVQFLESLPSSVFAKIADYVSDVKEYQVLLVSERISINKKTKTVFLDIDIPFFTTM